MPEAIVKYKTVESLKALYNSAKTFDLVIENAVTTSSVAAEKQKPALPITFAKTPNVKALAGIWKDRNITLENCASFKFI
jgi:hypothetical protein